MRHSKRRGLAVTKRGAGEAVNDERHGISYKRACDRLLEIPAFRQSGEESFCLDFSCFVLFGKKKNEVGVRGRSHLPDAYFKNNYNL
jgi:hypothetical protein